MDIFLRSSFLKWCCIINFSCLVFSSLAISMMPGAIYRVHSQLFNLTRQSFNTQVYQFLGIYKVLILIFNFAPFLALWAIQT
ncbi:DUF6868 family protein [Zhongshania sp.]|uniref:DUF6868 family protein n=1 Tax=Zhongshania sp. TaxID=1971902 RepID=UPI0039E68CFF